MSLYTELKDRKVIRVAAVYLVVAWLIMQVIAVVSDPLYLPEWFDTAIILFLAVGFPVALILSWAFDVTPAPESEGTSKQISGKPLAIGLIAVTAIVVGFILTGFNGGGSELASDSAIDSEMAGAESIQVTESAAPIQTRLPNSIAVLPFENLSPDPNNAYFAAGIHDTILHELAKNEDLNVIARTSMLQFSDGQTSIAEVARQLNVETVMEGSVQYAADQVRITAQLIDPATGAHIWSGNYDRNFADIFAIQSEVAARIAEALEAKILPRQLQSVAVFPTNSKEAYALYLQAKALVPNIAPRSAPEFYELLEQSVLIDPDFALAHATLAFAYGRAVGFTDLPLGGSFETQEALVRDHAEAALNIDPNQGLAEAALGMLEASYFQIDLAEDHWNRALEVSPNDVEILDDAIIFYQYAGQVERAELLQNRMRILNPGVLAGSDFYLAVVSGRFLEAAEYFAGTWRFMPKIVPVQKLLAAYTGLAKAVGGDTEGALQTLQEAEGLEPKTSTYELAQIAYAYSRINRPADAERIVEQIHAIANDDNLPNKVLSYSWVNAYLAVNDQENALKWLNITVNNPGPQAGSHDMVSDLMRNSYRDPILDQAEFVELRKVLGFQN